ncbi:Asp23/Gls24 family envelope stress response protein [Microbacterium sp. NPDC077663]|uniref:Asp23/Gls24 family envelope stress response protein n=1 Tax=Microbacterium sp. NPDC077663 TaxID=3364189 RepID=UPI0037C9182B
MAENQNTPTPSAAAPAARVDRAPVSRKAENSSVAGTITIADGVVSKVAGIAAREVSGVYALGGGGARAIGAIRDAINATDLTQGVKVEVGETQAAVDLKVVVEYPAPIGRVADEVRSSVAGAVHRLTGLDVVEVNVEIHDVHIEDESDEQAEPRVA